MQESRKAAIVAALLFGMCQPSLAQEVAETTDQSVQIELNSATETENGGCLLTMVTTNMMQQALSRAAWQVAIFDSAGVVEALTILDFGAMTSGKTKVAMFELPGRSCADVGRIVVNDVAECRAEDETDLRAACLSGLATQSRTNIDFGL